MMGCLTENGPPDGKAVREKLGHVAWFAIKGMGGWEDLCRVTYDQLSTTIAQLRTYCKTAIQVNERDPESCQLEFQKYGNSQMNNSNQLKKLEFNL